MKTWAQRIKDLEAAGWALSQIAERCGLSYSALSDIKQARSKEPRGMAAVKLHDLEGRKPPAAKKAA